MVTGSELTFIVKSLTNSTNHVCLLKLCLTMCVVNNNIVVIIYTPVFIQRNFCVLVAFLGLPVLGPPDALSLLAPPPLEVTRLATSC